VSYALPAEHGAWALWLGPLTVGLGVGGWHGGPTPCLVAAQTAAFLSRHPLILLAGTTSGRRSRDDVAPAIAWLTMYVTAGVVLGIGVIAMGYTALWWAVLPVAPTGLWQVWLVRRRAERKMTLELAGSGALTYAAFNLGGSVALAVWHVTPPLVPGAFAAMLVQVVAGVGVPAIGARPRRLGLEQPAATVVFSVLLILAYRIWTGRAHVLASDLVRSRVDRLT
jgi:hypothetical protein